jgi:cell division control protein 7
MQAAIVIFVLISSAVDVWSAGIIMLCLLSGKYPFFRCMDDMTAIAQIITVFGKQRVVESTKHLGKFVQFSHLLQV